ncbi:CCA tRNA nucleotidyltransferase, mitochondrial [Mucor velutinosus]|uniref:CCA tRNA nucleotidyltransferase, mitochondrial n=1 Tax=Mucor velutinosus TaxID=708070 RepID=A0AAN7DA67_9FUNG|nr:CCA tRNA nucleotidyltransferase, mitochondrial [Mucor velutinosus]
MAMPALDYNNTNTVRFSLASCVTEDSVDSVALATPLDQSPPPPPSNTFSIINIVNDDPLPGMSNYPAIASTYMARRRRAQTSPRPVPTSIIQSMPPQQPTMVHTTSANQADTSDTKSKMSKLWPKIKRIIMSANHHNEGSLEPMHLHTTKLESPHSSSLQTKGKRWLGRNKSRVEPQR